LVGVLPLIAETKVCGRGNIIAYWWTNKALDGASNVGSPGWRNDSGR
jgi:hypothetical protein